jgi:hypothetical protein
MSQREGFSSPAAVNQDVECARVFLMFFCLCSDQQVLKSWDPMADDYFSERNSYQVDIDDPGVATVGYSV